MRAWMISFGVATAILVVAALLIDEGEVVHLETTDASGQHFEADLWIVDVGGTLYLRANDDDLGWLEADSKRSRGLFGARRADPRPS